jgi:hypothetical protein
MLKKALILSCLLATHGHSALLTEASAHFTADGNWNFSCFDFGVSQAACLIDESFGASSFVQISPRAEASSGFVGAYSTSMFDVSEFSLIGMEQTHVLASWSDIWRLSGGSGSGFIRYDFFVRAYLSSDDPSGGFGFDHDGAQAIFQPGFSSFEGALSTMLMPFDWGVPFDMQATASAFVAGQNFAQGGGGATIDGELLGIAVFDTEGNLLSSSEYTLETGVIPEPSALVLAAFGLLSFAMWKSRRPS